MQSTSQESCRSSDPCASCVEIFDRRLTESGYAQHTIDGDLARLKHFALWLHRRQLQLRQLSEALIGEFIDGHLRHCDCPEPVRSGRGAMRATLHRLLTALRTAGIVPRPPKPASSFDDELQRYDEYMDRVRGLAPQTRLQGLGIVRRFLESRFRNGPVVFSVVTPEHVRRFFARQCERYSSPQGAQSLIAALRCYFRYRATCGDAVYRLIGAVPYPANWQQSTLPKGLSAEEVEQLVHSFGQSGRGRRRADAIVRCALDLGLRAGEIARLQLDDIDWQAGTITLRRTKGRRQDVMPLPAATGEAIAAYLQRERPKTSQRTVFVRRVPPCDLPITRDSVSHVIKHAYARAGLPYTRSHLLRHTMASRILEGGGSLKEVADVLRHRSLNTTLVYAKLDSTRLREVALPWPGVVS